MKNIKATVKGNMLILEVDLTQRLGKSASGKTILIASSQGNVPLKEDEDIKMGINIYRTKGE